MSIHTVLNLELGKADTSNPRNLLHPELVGATLQLRIYGSINGARSMYVETFVLKQASLLMSHPLRHEPEKPITQTIKLFTAEAGTITVKIDKQQELIVALAITNYEESFSINCELATLTFSKPDILPKENQKAHRLAEFAVKLEEA